jgi:hypothetical protein
MRRTGQTVLAVFLSGGFEAGMTYRHGWNLEDRDAASGR